MSTHAESFLGLTALLWAKTNRKNSKNPVRFHPLICHSVDVGMVGHALWEESLPASTRRWIAGLLGVTEEEAGWLLAYWVALHDLGKATAIFQARWRPGREQLIGAGFTFDPLSEAGIQVYHATLTTCILETLPEDEFGAPREVARLVGRALGGHHGLWPTLESIARQQDQQRQIGDQPVWMRARSELVAVLRRVFHPVRIEKLGGDRLSQSTLLMFLSGLTSIADWLGSMEEYFPFRANLADFEAYAQEAEQIAQRVLHKEGWARWTPAPEALDFAELFRFAPNRLQRRVMELTQESTEPTLLILEMQTGSGKSEAALVGADNQARLLEQRGFYIAMPTSATSNQMYTRTNRFLDRRNPNRDRSLRLLHAQAQWLGLESIPELNLDAQEKPEETDSDARRVHDQSWFLPAKRGLLSPLAVGTVDQALLSVLQARHFFVRLWGLASKTVIFDEVHAYDTYMSTVFERLLSWLRVMGTSVIILSATLPANTRRRLAAAYMLASEKQMEMPKFVYPGLTYIRGCNIISEHIPMGESTPVRLKRIARDPSAIGKLLAEKLADGGCAAVICNTVGRAQKVYQVLKEGKERGELPDAEIILFHARFPMAWRNEIERKVFCRFGKPATNAAESDVEDAAPDSEEGCSPPPLDTVRPCTILVATQVVEQSLDLDFDLMISDLAPIDLLIQRAGRLWRHSRCRPDIIAERWFYIAVDLDETGEPDQAEDKLVYDRLIMLASWYTLKAKGIKHENGGMWSAPDHTAEMIEAVYGDDPSQLFTPSQRASLDRERSNYDDRLLADTAEARKRVVKDPRKSDVMDLSGIERVAEDVSVHQDLQALTRLGLPNVQVICLFDTGMGLNTREDGMGIVIDFEERPLPAIVRELVLNGVAVSRPELFQYFIRSAPPAGWNKHPLLRHYRMVVFDEHGVAHVGPSANEGKGFTLRLSREYGLQIERERGE